jgi:hypothetical protein
MPGRLQPPLLLLPLVLALSCASPPPVAKQPAVFVPADDEEAAVAWQQAHPPPPPYTFDWERVRKLWEKHPTEPPCDACRMGPPTDGWCCFPGEKKMRAAKVTLWRSPDESHTWLKLDIGSEALVTKDWYAALVDERGHLITPWAALEYVRPKNAAVVVQFESERLDMESARVALVEDPSE